MSNSEWLTIKIVESTIELAFTFNKSTYDTSHGCDTICAFLCSSRLFLNFINKIFLPFYQNKNKNTNCAVNDMGKRRRKYLLFPKYQLITVIWYFSPMKE